MFPSLVAFLGHISIVIWVFLLFLILLFAVSAAMMLIGRMVLRRKLKVFTNAVKQVATDDLKNRARGLSLAQLDKMRVSLDNLDGLPKAWWNRLNHSISLYVNEKEEDEWFITQPVNELLPYDVVVRQNFHTAQYSAIPGILTGLGLTGTFIAILLALYGVHYDELNTVKPVTGMENLINGLSGKFLSSIVALLLSIIFTVLEKQIVRGLQRSYLAMIAAVSDAIPYLPTSRILLDIHRFSAKQTVSVSNISSEVVDRLTNAFNDRVVPNLAAGMSSGVAEKLQSEFRPTMERMVGSLDSLQSAIVRLESEKKDSVTGEFGSMIDVLKESISGALLTMGEQFREALSGSAREEFGNVQGTLEATRHVLSEMNAQFGQMQTALGVIIAKTEETTTGQMEAGRKQTEELNALMHGLMTKLQETAEQNISNVHTQLTRVVSDLTDNVTKLSVDMMDASKDMARHSQESAGSIIEKTDAWSEATAKRLESLLANIEDRSNDFKRASEALLEAKTFMSNLLAQNGNALMQMQDASLNVQTYSKGLAGQADSLKAISGDQSKVANQLLLTSGALKSLYDQHQQQLAEYRRTMDEYKSVIDQLHEPISKIMKATSDGLRDYNQSIEKNFTKVVEIADKLFPKGANLLSTQIEELGEQLEELQEVIAKSVGSSNGRAK
jgi:gas vesicle protein